MIVRHLRTLYPDPVSGAPLRVIRDPLDHGIEGVYSPSRATPLKVAGFPPADHAFTGARHYTQWRFVLVPPSGWPLRSGFGK